MNTHVCLTVGLHIREIILVASEPQTEASLLPELLKVCLALFWSVIELRVMSVNGMVGSC